MDAPLPGGEEECIPRSGRGEIGSGEGRRAVPFGGGRAIGSTSAQGGPPFPSAPRVPSVQRNVPLIFITTILSHDAYTGLVNGATSAPCLGGCVGAGGVAPRC
jgi:hypothetical protein